MHKYLVNIIYIALMFFFPLFAFAEGEDSQTKPEEVWEKGFFIGISLGSAVFVDDNGQNISPAGSFDFQLGHDIPGIFIVGARLGQVYATGSSYDSIRDESIQRSTAVHYFGFFIKAKLLQKRITPYISLGLGRYTMDNAPIGNRYASKDGLILQVAPYVRIVVASPV